MPNIFSIHWLNLNMKLWLGWVLNSATTPSTSRLFAASNRSKVLLAFFSDAMSASTSPWVGIK